MTYTNTTPRTLTNPAIVAITLIACAISVTSILAIFLVLYPLMGLALTLTPVLGVPAFSLLMGGCVLCLTVAVVAMVSWYSMIVDPDPR